MSKLTGLWLLVELIYYQTIVVRPGSALYFHLYDSPGMLWLCAYCKTVVQNLQQLHFHVAVFLRFLANKYAIKTLCRVLLNFQCAQLRLGWYHCEGWSYALRWITVLIMAYGVNVDAFKSRLVQNACKWCPVFRLQHKVHPLVPNQHSWQLLLLTISILISTPFLNCFENLTLKSKTCLTSWKREAENLSCVLLRFELNAGAKRINTRRLAKEENTVKSTRTIVT